MRKNKQAIILTIELFNYFFLNFSVEVVWWEVFQHVKKGKSLKGSSRHLKIKE